MNFPFFIAKRYLISKKSQNVINIITKIAITGVAVGTMALIVVLSAFNGIENLVVSLFNAFDPDIKVTVAEGKTFDKTLTQLKKIKELPGVAFYTEVIEENALLKYKEKQYIATIKGVGKNFTAMSRLDTMLIEGEFKLEGRGGNFAVLGHGVAAQLGINLLSLINPIYIYVPRRTKEISMSPEKAFKTSTVYPSGIFSIQHDFDSKYIIVPLNLATELLDYHNKITAIEIGVKKGFKVGKVQSQIEEILGEQFDVKDRFQQHDLLYKIMKSEKWAVYLILTFILVIATFNVIGSLTMLIIDKKKDIRILSNMGASTRVIRKIFFFEGLLIAVSGALIGLSAGYLLCLVQKHYGLLKLQGAFVMEAYPVAMQLNDFIYVFATVIIIGAFAAWFPARQITKIAD